MSHRIKKWFNSCWERSKCGKLVSDVEELSSHARLTQKQKHRLFVCMTGAVLGVPTFTARAIPILIDLLGYIHPASRRIDDIPCIIAARLLARIGAPAKPALLEILSRPRSSSRDLIWKYAAVALGMTGDDRALPALVDIVKGPRETSSFYWENGEGKCTSYCDSCVFNAAVKLLRSKIS